MIEKQVTISYDEFESMKKELELLRESKLCALYVHTGMYNNYVSFSLNTTEELENKFSEILKSYKGELQKPLENKIKELLAIVDKKNTMIEDCQKFIEECQKFIEECQKDKLNKWWEFWK